MERPTRGEGGVPTAAGGDRLTARIRWTNEFVLDPPAADQQAQVDPATLRKDRIGPDPVTKLAVLTDPLHRPFLGQHRLVWAVFVAQGFPALSGGPYSPGGTPTTVPVDPPCAMAVSFFDAATGESLSIIGSG